MVAADPSAPGDYRDTGFGGRCDRRDILAAGSGSGAGYPHCHYFKVLWETSVKTGVFFIVRPRACFLARSFSGSEKRRVRKPKNHLLCKWIMMLQLTEKPPML